MKKDNTVLWLDGGFSLSSWGLVFLFALYIPHPPTPNIILAMAT